MKKIKAYLLTLWALFMGWVTVFPADLINIWQIMPSDIKDAMGTHTAKVIGFAILAVSVGKMIFGLKKENLQLKQKVEDSTNSEVNNGN